MQTDQVVVAQYDFTYWLFSLFFMAYLTNAVVSGYHFFRLAYI